jgi:hypothetical protein
MFGGFLKIFIDCLAIGYFLHWQAPPQQSVNEISVIIFSFSASGYLASISDYASINCCQDSAAACQ